MKISSKIYNIKLLLLVFIFNCYEIFVVFYLINYLIIFYLHVSQFVQFWNTEINSNKEITSLKNRSNHVKLVKLTFLLIKTLITIVLPIQSKE